MISFLMANVSLDFIGFLFCMFEVFINIQNINFWLTKKSATNVHQLYWKVRNLKKYDVSFWVFNTTEKQFNHCVVSIHCSILLNVIFFYIFSINIEVQKGISTNTFHCYKNIQNIIGLIWNIKNNLEITLRLLNFRNFPLHEQKPLKLPTILPSHLINTTPSTDDIGGFTINCKHWLHCCH